jgi:hypothetical protein
MTNEPNEPEISLTPEEKAKLEVLQALAAEGFRELDEGKGILLRNDRDLIVFIDEISRRVAERHRNFTSPDPPPTDTAGPF